MTCMCSKTLTGDFKRSLFDGKPVPSEVTTTPVIGKASIVEMSQIGEDANASSLDRGDLS